MKDTVFRLRYYCRIRPLPWLFALLLFLASCERRELTYSEESEVEIIADWSRSALSENEQRYGATAMFYSVDGISAPIVVLMGDRNHKTVRLKGGSYDVVLFNRSFDDFGSIAFRGTGGYHALEAYAKNAQTKEAGGDKFSTDSPDGLAADRVSGFEVNETSCQLCFSPVTLTKELTVTVHIKGMNNIRTATCELDGVSESVFLDSGDASGQTMTQVFKLGNPVYLPGSKTDGAMSATFSVFGFDGGASHAMHFKALLVDGKTVFEEDIEGMEVDVTEDEEGTIHIIVDMACTGIVPTVKPEGSSGLDADVEDWGNNENADIDI